jgi:hypothetical protein
MDILIARSMRRGVLVSTTVLLFVLTSAQPAIPEAQAQGALGQEQDTRGKSSYDQVTPTLLGQETFQDRVAKDKAAKADFSTRQRQLLESRYDLAPRPDAKVRMSRGNRSRSDRLRDFPKA